MDPVEDDELLRLPGTGEELLPQGEVDDGVLAGVEDPDGPGGDPPDGMVRVDGEEEARGIPGVLVPDEAEARGRHPDVAGEARVRGRRDGGVPPAVTCPHGIDRDLPAARDNLP